MALIPWYHAQLYELGQRKAWFRNAQQIDDAAETSPPLGRNYFYANLSTTRTARLVFVKRSGERAEWDIPPNTQETALQVPAAYQDYEGAYTFGWIN